MLQVFVDFDCRLVGQMQSLLVANGIESCLKTQFGFGGAGELPFVETVPQLYVLDENEVARALLLMKNEAESVPGDAWACEQCGAEVDSNFTQCWQCLAARKKD